MTSNKRSKSNNTSWPEHISTELELDEVMTSPSPALIKMMKQLEGDIIILGIAGKMGATLGELAFRACKEAGVKKRIIGVSRFSDTSIRQSLKEIGLETISCDLLDRDAVSKLPQVANVIFMAGRKFGTTGSTALTWVMNTLVPGNVAAHFSKSRIVAFSTGCVYPLTDISKGGCTENDPTTAVGDYAQSCLGRENVFQYYAETHQTPSLIYRLCYAIDLRYGVLREIAQKVWDNQPIDVTMGYANVIWQGDANSQALLCLNHCSSPAKIINVTGLETISIREIAREFGKLMGRKPQIQGKESKTALLANAKQAAKLLEEPRISLDQMIRWTAHWVTQNGRSLNKPTHFEVRDGNF